jgi:UTP:GlnB (protein PII) uridylyltransferase
LVRALWDTGLTIGCVSRTLAQCRMILGDDLATDTSFLEATYIAGNKEYFKTLMHAVVGDYFQKNRRSFLRVSKFAVSDRTACEKRHLRFA